MKRLESPAHKDTLDELLIGAVKARKGLYDCGISASKRSNLCKNALWAEVSNTLGEQRALQAALMEALKEPIVQATNPLDRFLIRLGEGMQRLPHRDRPLLEIEFLTMLFEKENIYANNDIESSTRY